jgi:ABC-type oligopeptide transport system ATPase subunit
MEWVYALGSSVTAKILVLRGEAGTGKSTLAREICRQLEAINRLGGSFFFVQNDSSGLESTKNVIPTIASQLAALQDAFRPYIANAARKYTTFETASLKDQMKSLILDPVAEARAKYSWLTRIPVVIVLDALDEAGADLVNFFDSLKDLVDAQCNFWVFVTTRPEPSIENAFRESGMSVMQTQVKMDDAPQDEVDNDIHNFMRQRFERLQWKSELIAAHPDSVEVLTTKAERLFIYARTVIDYLDHKVQETSLRRLSAILRDGSDKVGLPALDALYTTVLQNAYDQESLEGDDVRERVTALLAGLVVLRQDVTVEVLAPLIGMKEDAVIRTARELRSILSCSSEDLHTAVIRPIHLTLAEFLVDDKRCTNSAFYVDRRAWHFDFAKACLGELNAILRRNLCGWSGDDDSIKSREERRLLVQKRVPAHALYACENWTAHFVEVEQSSDPALLRVLDEFCRKILLPWIEVQSYAGNLCDAKRMLWNAHSWAKVCVILHFGFPLLKYNCVLSGTRPSDSFEYSIRCMGVSGLVL